MSCACALILSRRLTIAIHVSANARKHQEGIVSQSVVYFTGHVPVNTVVGGPMPLKLRKILDMVCEM